MRRLLLIEDEEVILRALTRLLERHRHDVVAVRDVDAAEALDPRSFDLVLADLRLPGRDGTAVIPLVAPVPVVIMTSHASVRSAVEAMRAGASDYIAKPFDHDELLLVLERAFNRVRLLARNQTLERELARAEPAARRIVDTSLEPLVSAIVDGGGAPLHLFGESGAGREDIARESHARGPQASAPLLVVDGTRELDASVCDVARGGTLVLRHPERLSAAAQEALAARLSPSGTATTPGERVDSSPFRLVTLAHEDIATLCGDGRLVAALAGHLAERQHEVPPLRARRGDVATLARRAAHAFGERHAGCPATLSDRALATLGAGDLIGNVAALERTVELAVLESVAACEVPPLDELALPDGAFDAAGNLPATLDLDGYFRYLVLELQDRLSETELAVRLGMSRKALWERRHRMGLPRPTRPPSTS